MSNVTPTLNVGYQDTGQLFTMNDVELDEEYYSDDSSESSVKVIPIGFNLPDPNFTQSSAIAMSDSSSSYYEEESGSDDDNLYGVLMKDNYESEPATQQTQKPSIQNNRSIKITPSRSNPNITLKPSTKPNITVPYSGSIPNQIPFATQQQNINSDPIQNYNLQNIYIAPVDSNLVPSNFIPDTIENEPTQFQQQLNTFSSPQYIERPQYPQPMQRFPLTNVTRNHSADVLIPPHFQQPQSQQRYDITNPIQIPDFPTPPSVDDIKLENNLNEIENVIDFLQKPVTEPKALQKRTATVHSSRSKPDIPRGGLQIGTMTRYERTPQGEEFTERDVANTNEKQKVLYVLPKGAQSAQKPINLIAKESLYSRNGLHVEIPSSKKIIQDAPKPMMVSAGGREFTVQGKTPNLSGPSSNGFDSESDDSQAKVLKTRSFNNLNIEPPKNDKVLQMQWTKKPMVPDFRKSTKPEAALRNIVTKTSLDVVKNGIDVFGDDDIDEEELLKLLGKDSPHIEKPRHMDDHSIHDVEYKANDGTTIRHKSIIISGSSDPGANITVVKPTLAKSIPVSVNRGFYTIAEMLQIGEELKKEGLIKPKTTTPTPGLINLLQLHIEMKNPSEYRNSQLRMTIGEPTRIAAPTKEAPKPAPVVTVSENPDRFIPRSMAKKIGVYDEKSDEEYKQFVKVSFNRLTERTMEASLKEFAKKMNNTEKVEFAVDVFIKKAIKEPPFAMLHARFASLLKNEEFKVKVRTEMIQEFNNAIEDPGKQERLDDVTNDVGITTFFAALLNTKVIPFSNGHSSIAALFEKLDQPDSNTNLIEMLGKFVPAAGQEFVEEMDAQHWQRLKKLIANKDIKPRLHFMLVETLEQRDKWKSGEDVAPVETYEKPSDNTVNVVRQTFVTYMEEHVGIPEMEEKAPEIDQSVGIFLSSAMQYLIDVKQELFHYCMFCATVLKMKEAYADDVLEIMAQGIQEYQENGVQADCPHIWASLTDMLITFLLKRVFLMQEATELHEMFAPKWDFLNDLKWYLFDNWDFHRSFRVKEVESIEMSTVLAMPRIVNEKEILIPVMSRMVAVAICRTIFTQMERNRVVHFTAFPDKFRDLFRLVSKRFKDTLAEEADIAIGNSGVFTFTLNEFLDTYVG